MYYILYRNQAFEDKYISVIKARSYEYAKRILVDKIHEEEKDVKIKDIHGSMFHKEFLIKMEAF